MHQGQTQTAVDQQTTQERIDVRVCADKPAERSGGRSALPPPGPVNPAASLPLLPFLCSEQDVLGYIAALEAERDELADQAAEMRALPAWSRA